MDLDQAKILEQMASRSYIHVTLSVTPSAQHLKQMGKTGRCDENCALVIMPVCFISSSTKLAMSIIV